MIRFWLPAALLCLLLSCTRSSPDPAAGDILSETASGETPQVLPDAILRAGEYPLWFQVSETGPVLLDSIADAQFSRALIPWPLATHITGILARGDELLMAVNREGFLRFSPRDQNDGIGVFRFSGGEFWRRYTVGAFVLFEGKPAALLYRDGRFLDSPAEPPQPRVWTFNRESAEPEGLDIPALDQFPPADGWEADTLRFGSDGLWYYRVLKPNEPHPDIRLFHTASLRQPGKAVSLGDFQNSALPEPLHAAPAPLKELLETAVAMTGAASVQVISPEFPQQRIFAGKASGSGLLAYYRPGSVDDPLVVAILPNGQGVYLSPHSAARDDTVKPESRLFTLPSLPEGFVYTGIGLAGGGPATTLFAVWEEQEEYSTGAAGFMVLRMPPMESDTE
jgi:hypothetical protein